MRIDLPNPDRFAAIFAEVTGTMLSNPVKGIVTDNRESQPGDLYIAIRGSRVDGHLFLPVVEKSGCTTALVSEQNDNLTNIQQIVVADPVVVIGQIAHVWRKQFDIPIIGITGSNGKTSTKELLRHIFQTNQTVHATEGNFNTSIGLPLTLLRITSSHSLSILELGANQPGDISYLCQIAEPTHGLITNIAPAHLEGFGTVAAVAKEKGELFNYLSNGTAFVNLADKWVEKLSIPGAKITYGLTPDCDFPGDIYNEDDGTLTLTIDTMEIQSQSHNFSFAKNILACAAVTITMGVDWKIFQERVLSFAPPAGRCQVRQFQDITIIDDTYNANLESTIASIDYLNALSKNGRRLLVFGDMFELGNKSNEIHRKVGEKCSEAKLDAVFTVGPLTLYTDLALENVNIHKHFESKEDLVTELKNVISDGDKILIKGSRGMAMEEIIQELFT